MWYQDVRKALEAPLNIKDVIYQKHLASRRQLMMNNTPSSVH